jgi:hypothetical protein
MRIVHAKTDSNRRHKVFAADNVFADEPEFNGPDVEDTDADGEDEDLLDEPLDDELQQDSSAIEIDNNITNHLIAECQNCHGIFISAMIASDQLIDSINGVCPLCNKDTEQSLKWIVKDYPEDI